MKKKFLMQIILLVCSFFSVNAADYQVKGVVVDAEGLPLPSATVLLFKENTTTQDKGEVTDMDGKFSFTNLVEGNYRIEISFMGFKTKNISFSLTSEKPQKKYNKIVLQEESSLLTAVEVSAKRSSYQVDIDKKTFIVNESAVSEGMSASEVLKEIPSVDIDVEGNVSMRNSENVEIYINGKAAGLTEDNRGDILEQLPAGSIERVEIISNPSSKFDAEGSAGIINIVMKKNDTKASYYGSVSGGISYPWGGKPGGNVSGNINFLKGKWSSYFNLGYTNRRSIGSGETRRESYKQDTVLLYQHSENDFTMQSTFLRAGTDCQIDSLNNIGISGSFTIGGRDRNQFIDYDKGYLSQGIKLFNAYQSRNSVTSNTRLSGNATLDYTHTFAAGHTLSSSFNFSANKMDNNKDFEQKNYDSLRTSTPELDYIQEQKAINSNRNFEGRIDYVNPITTTSKLEAGTKLTFQNQYSDVNSSIERYNNNEFIPQHELDNDFELHQHIYAAYASYGNKIHKFAMQVGLRGELTDQNWTLTTTGQQSEKNPYFNVFPTLFLSYTVSDNNEFQLSYTRRISRPRRSALNPYINVTDSTDISFGNPDLDPEFANSFEFNYIKYFAEHKHMFMTTIYYQLRQDVIQKYSWMNGEAIVSTFANMTTSHSTGTELVLKNHWKKVDLTSNVNLYYYKLNGCDFTIDAADNGTSSDIKIKTDGRTSFSWTAKISADYILPRNFNLQVSGNYRAPRATAQGKSLASYLVNMGMKKTFLEKRLSATLSVRDLLNSRKRKSETWDEDFYQYTETGWSGRMINFNLTYNFGNMQKKKGKKNNNKSDSSIDNDDDFDDF